MPGSTRVALAIRHGAIGHLGSFERVLVSQGYAIRYIDGVNITDAADDADLVVVLGGDMGVAETEAYPFLLDELVFLERRLEREQPTFGVCLGAQLMAQSLGGAVRRGTTVEIGFRAVTPTEAGLDSPLRHIAGVPMMQWHGDTFSLPAGATRLASSDEYSNEAFALGDYALAVQFHGELHGSMFEEWAADGAAELRANGIDPLHLIAEAAEHGGTMERAAALMLRDWLEGLER